MHFLQLWVEKLWYSGKRVGVFYALLYPLSRCYQRLVEKRRRDYLLGKKPSSAMACPVIVVGNITVGGTGKTPLVIWLVEQLQQHGYQPGVVSRGYGGTGGSFPMEVGLESDPVVVGDEPAMIARRVSAPVIIDPDRVRGAKYLSEDLACDIVVSDDGLQHYSLKRDIEIAVVDGKRGLGNGLCLPGGPLREPVQRLDTVDFVIINSAVNSDSNGLASVPGLSPQAISQTLQMRIVPDKMCSLQGKSSVDVNAVQCLKQPVHALAGIGNPSRFFDTLERMGVTFYPHAYPDHYQYKASDVNFADGHDIVMTEKDAIKCQSFASSRCFYLSVNAQMDPEFWPRLQAKISDVLLIHP